MPMYVLQESIFKTALRYDDQKLPHPRVGGGPTRVIIYNKVKILSADVIYVSNILQLDF